MRERCNITVTAASWHKYRDADLEGVDVAETILDMAIDDELRQTQNLTTQVERVAEPRLLSLLHTHTAVQRPFLQDYPSEPVLQM